jgi:hypothetical protein
MRVDKWLGIAGAVLMGALAFGQTDQTSSAPQSTTAPSPDKTSPPRQTNDKCPCKPRTVVDAASTSKQKAESEPGAKTYRNKDLKDPAETSVTSEGATTPLSVPKSAPAPTSAKKELATPADPLQSPAAFKAQGDVYRNQILLQKEKIADVQSRITDLKYQFDEWSASLAQDPTSASICWSSSYSTPYYKDWCDTGRNLKAQYDVVQGQLKQEKANLEKMQEEIRRKGYGNAVYDPDWP